MTAARGIADYFADVDVWRECHPPAQHQLVRIAQEHWMRLLFRYTKSPCTKSPCTQLSRFVPSRISLSQVCLIATIAAVSHGLSTPALAQDVQCGPPKRLASPPP